MATEQIPPSTNVPSATVSRYVIWDEASDPGVECESALMILLRKSGLGSLQALHGVEVTTPSELTVETERLLLQFNLGVIGHAYWPAGGRDEKAVPASVLDQSVEVLQLSARPGNCLLHAGIATVGELMLRSRDDLLRIRNMGRKSLDEIYCRLSELMPEGTSPQRPEATLLGSFSLALLLPFEECGVPVDIAQRLRASGVADFSDLLGMGTEAIRFRGKLRPAELQALQTSLLHHRLRLGAHPPSWIRDHFEECRSAFRDDINRILGTREVASTEPFIAPLAFSPPSCLEEELEALLSPRSREKWLPIIRRVLGWDGGAGTTLEVTGQEFGLTRERIRQIVSKSLQNRRSHASSFLNRALDVVRQRAPCSAEQAEAALVDQQIVRSPMRVECILATAGALDIEVPWHIEQHGSSRVILGPDDGNLITEFFREARRRIRRFGATRKSYILEALGWAQPSELADLCFSAAPDLVWLDESRDWFWIPTARNPVASRLLKILRVAPSLEITLAAAGVLRDRRMEGTELPLGVFRALCNLMPWCRADAEQVCALDELPPEEETDSDEVLICRVLQENGPVMWRRDLWRLANDLGVEKVSFDRHLSESNVLVRLAPEVYGLIGSSGMPATEAEPVPLVESPVEDCGEATAESSSFLDGCDPGSPDFPLQMLTRALSRSVTLRQRSVWSLVELGWSDQDLQTIRTWSQIGTFEMREIRNQVVSCGSARFDGVEALALAFLACCSDIAMVRADENEMWPTIQSTFGVGLRARLFQGPGYPKSRIREATERICSRLRIRHVFGREGEQSWRRTVFLQFGITRSGRKRLPWWLSGNSIVPVAVEELLSSQALRSESFGEFWRTLQRYRAGQLTYSRSAALLRGNPWVRGSEIDAVLCAANERRDLQRSQEAVVEAATEDADCLFDVPLLSWQRESPVFELPLRSRSRWLTEPRYALALGNGKRIPVTLHDGEYKVDGRLEVDLTEEVVTVDLRRGQIGCLPQPISISLTPEGYDFVFYDLTTGEPLLFGNERVAQDRPLALLARAALETTTEALEMRRVFDGAWTIRAYRSGVPRDFEIRRDGRTVWESEDIRHPTGSAGVPRLRVACAGGRWGDPAVFTVHPASDTTPTHLLICGKRVQLDKAIDGTYRAAVPLTPSVKYEDASVRVECIWRDRVRWFGATLSIGPLEGIAIEAEDGWKVLKETADMDASFLAIHRIFARLPAQFGGDRVSTADWAWMEGSHFCGRPRTSPMVLGAAVHAVGEPLRLAVGPYNQASEGRTIARSVIHSGVIGWIEQKDDDWHIQFRRSFELGSEHDIWIWPAQAGAPHLLNRAAWRQEGDACLARVDPGSTPVAFAVSFQGSWLGARTCGQGWAGLIDVLRCCQDWQTSAPWLKWWRVPLLHPALKAIASELVRSQPIASIEAWVFGDGLLTMARSTEDQEDAWRALTRTLLWDWLPTPAEAATVLRNCGLLAGVFEDDVRRAWEGYEELLAVHPVLLAQVAARGTASLYSGDADAVRGFLEILRNRILAVGLRTPREAVSRELQDAKRMAAEAMAVDDAFVSRSLLPDAIAYAQGRLDHPHNLRVALANSYAVPQYLAATMIDKAIAGDIVL